MAERRLPLIRRFPSLQALSEAAAQEVLRAASEARGSFSLCLSGGHTPTQLYALLNAAYRVNFPWERTHFFLGDERAVPFADPQSNWGAIGKTLFHEIPVDPAHLHPIPPPPASPAEAAGRYEASLRKFFDGTPRFDLLLLGLGPDGHTASLFPGTDALTEKDRLVVPVPPAGSRIARITLTVPALNSAKRILFLVSGGEKRRALAQTLGTASPGAQQLPAQLIRRDPSVIWLVDGDAAQDLPPEQP